MSDSIWRLEVWSTHAKVWVDISDHSAQGGALRALDQRRDVTGGPSWLSDGQRRDDAAKTYRIVRFDPAAVTTYEPDALTVSDGAA